MAFGYQRAESRLDDVDGGVVCEAQRRRLVPRIVVEDLQLDSTMESQDKGGRWFQVHGDDGNTDHLMDPVAVPLVMRMTLVEHSTVPAAQLPGPLDIDAAGRGVELNLKLSQAHLAEGVPEKQIEWQVGGYSVHLKSKPAWSARADSRSG